MFCPLQVGSKRSAPSPAPTAKQQKQQQQQQPTTPAPKKAKQAAEQPKAPNTAPAKQQQEGKQTPGKGKSVMGIRVQSIGYRVWVGLARTKIHMVHVRYFGIEITKYTVINGVYIDGSGQPEV
jgi:hypothetical protein